MKLKLLWAPAGLAALLLTSAVAFAYSGQRYAPQAKISIAKARSIALKTIPGGKITGEELEREAGDSGLRYSFDVKFKGRTHEVGVDAKTGKILENSVEGANPD